MKCKVGLFKTTAAAILTLALIIILSAGLIGFTRAEDSEDYIGSVEPRIWTDKSDYSPGENVTISGEGFTPNTAITITIQRPDGNEDTLYAESNSEGKFIAIYQLDGIEGEYTVTAKDECEKTAITKFTDHGGGGQPTISISFVKSSGSTYPPEKDTFLTNEDVYCVIQTTNTGSKTVKIYITYNDAWKDGQNPPPLNDVSGGYEVITINATMSSQIHGPFLIWRAPTTPGQYNIVVDENCNGVRDPGEKVDDSGSDSGFTIFRASISIDKYANANMAHVGDTIRYYYNVTNTGSVQLTNIQIVDNVTGTINIGTLQPGRHYVVYCNYTVKATDSDPLVNNATVYASYWYCGSWRQVSAWDTWTVDILHPAISVTKIANVSRAYAGNVIEYTINVTNVGDCTLYNVSVIDDILGNLTSHLPDRTFNIGERNTIIVTYTVNAGDPDPQNNTVTVSGEDNLGSVVSDDDYVEVDLVAKICGYKFHDTNKNGARDGGEEGLGDWTIQLFKWNGTAWELISSTTTNPDGSYCFDNLNAGTYNVTEVLQAGWRNTTSTIITIELKSGEISQGNNFGNIRQYELSIDTSPSSLNVLVNGTEIATPSTLLYDECTYVNLTAPNTIQISDGARYKFSHWNIDGVNWTSGQNQIIIHMNANCIATAHYTLEYYLTVISPYGTVGGEGWYDAGATAYATLNTGIVDHGNKTRRVFTHWSGDASGTNYAQSNPITMNGPKTAVANWKTQYNVTVTASPSEAIGGTFNVTYTQCGTTYNNVQRTTIWSDWVDANTNITVSSQEIINISPGTRLKFDQYDPANELNVTEPKTIILVYKTQYRLVVSISPDNLGIGNITISPAGDDPAGNGNWTSYWYDNCTYVTLEAPEYIYVSGGRYKFGKWYIDSTGNDSRIVEVHMDKPINATAEYSFAPAGLIVFTYEGIDSDFDGVVLNVDGVNYTRSQLPKGFTWYIGETHSFIYYSPLQVNDGKRYVWTQTKNATGAILPQSGTIVVTSDSDTITGYYKTQYKITFRQVGIGSDWTGVVLRVNGTAYTRGQLPTSFWCDEGSTLIFAWDSPLVVSRTKAYGWYKTTGLSSQPSGTITVNSSDEIVGYYMKIKPPVAPPAGDGGCKTISRKRR